MAARPKRTKPKVRRIKGTTPKMPNPRALERANANARFKRLPVQPPPSPAERVAAIRRQPGPGAAHPTPDAVHPRPTRPGAPSQFPNHTTPDAVHPRASRPGVPSRFPNHPAPTPVTGVTRPGKPPRPFPGRGTVPPGASVTVGAFAGGRIKPRVPKRPSY